MVLKAIQPYVIWNEAWKQGKFNIKCTNMNTGRVLMAFMCETFPATCSLIFKRYRRFRCDAVIDIRVLDLPFIFQYHKATVVGMWKWQAYCAGTVGEGLWFDVASSSSSSSASHHRPSALTAPVHCTTSHSAPHSRSSSWKKVKRHSSVNADLDKRRTSSSSASFEDAISAKLLELKLLQAEDCYVVRQFDTSPKVKYWLYCTSST